MVSEEQAVEDAQQGTTEVGDAPAQPGDRPEPAAPGAAESVTQPEPAATPEPTVAPEQSVAEATLEAVAAPIEAMAEEIRAQTYSEEHPLGPFKAPESVEIASIRENVGYVPRWLILLFILAILLALVLWIRPGGPLS